jgi:hypothetical protein
MGREGSFDINRIVNWYTIVAMEYFTPEIEDIRVGYEYEQMASESTWDKKTIQESTIRLGAFGTSNMRVPYLTIEQIEAEGWVITNGNTSGNEPNLISLWYRCYGTTYPYTLSYPCDGSHTLVIYLDPYTLYRGECKDINTFRYVCKLLNINDNCN